MPYVLSDVGGQKEQLACWRGPCVQAAYHTILFTCSAENAVEVLAQMHCMSGEEASTIVKKTIYLYISISLGREDKNMLVHYPSY